MNHNEFNPCTELYQRVRGGFISNGSTITAWCRDRDTTTSNAKAALMGTWNGPKGKALRAELIEASGISQPPVLDQVAN